MRPPHVLYLLAGLALAAPAAEPPPNIVFFLVDDLGYADVGFNGCRDLRTPRIDRLAREGAILRAHYVQPVCSPTRAALMTGRYPTRTGVYTVVRPRAMWGLPLAERTLADALKAAGYQTAITGKWHLGEFQPAYTPTARGFDHQYGHYFGAIDYFTHRRDGTHDWFRDGRELPETGYSTELIAAEACRLIRERDPARPLFLYVPFNGVHAPLQAPEKYLQPFTNLAGNRRTLAGMLAAVDAAVGRITDALADAGLRDRTLVVFSSDNGGPNPGRLSSNRPLRAGKGTVYEGGVRACAFACWPGRIPAGTTVDEPVHVIDWFPTLLKLAGGPPDQPLPLDGRDIWPVLAHGATSPHQAILLARSPTRAALRMGDWKLVAGPASPPELYQLSADPGERNNLAAREPERTKTMQAALAAMLRDAAPPGEPAAPAPRQPPARKRRQPAGS